MLSSINPSLGCIGGGLTRSALMLQRTSVEDPGRKIREDPLDDRSGPPVEERWCSPSRDEADVLNEYGRYSRQVRPSTRQLEEHADKINWISDEDMDDTD